MRGLAATRYARPGQVLCVRAPADIALFPWHTEDLGADAMNVNYRFSTEIANARLEADVTVWFDQHQTIESYRAPDVTAQGNTNASDFGSHPLGIASNALLIFELIGSAVEGFLDECTCRIGPLAANCRAHGGLAFRRIDIADRNLI